MIEVKDPNNFFQVQVSSKDYPDYKDRIMRPIAMKDMRMKTRRFEYKSSAQFVEDFTLMKENAAAYNGPAHWVVGIAGALEQEALRLC